MMRPKTIKTLLGSTQGARWPAARCVLERSSQSEGAAKNLWASCGRGLTNGLASFLAIAMATQAACPDSSVPSQETSA